MLAIRLQRIGRKGHPVYRIAVQEAQRHPSSGRVVAYVGSYDPHSKATKLNRDDLGKYLSNGAQPSPRVVRLLQAEKVKLPKWVQLPEAKNKAIKNLEKLRKNRPADEAPAEEPTAETEAAPVETDASSQA
ncbi:MAG TPA: 30S ribosomal protein S16 [Candidatus Saccharimonadales bacterium]|nr:30S ribosomal protein S16 [Candidatus Saccharimonadales bacterium]